MNHNARISNEWICVNRLQDAPVLVAHAPKTVQVRLNIFIGLDSAPEIQQAGFLTFFFYVVFKDIS